MALIDPELDSMLRSCASALRAYLADLVIIGGCASALYRHHPLASQTSIAGPGTKDIDVACPLRVPQGERPSVIEALRTGGFETRLFGSRTPPVMKFALRGATGGAELEFLCPLRGGPGRSRSSEPGAIEVQGGLTAQPLRYVEIHLLEPWQIELSRVPGFGDLSGLPPLRVPNPVSYMMQKVLVNRGQRRSTPSREKDCYYLFELSVVLRGAVAELKVELGKLHNRVPAAWVSRFRRDLNRLFGSAISEGPVAAARVGNAARSGNSRLPPIDEEMVFRSVSDFVASLGVESRTPGASDR